MKLTKSRQSNPSCYVCDKLITRNEPAYTSAKRKYCYSCGRMENDYANFGMYRPHVDFNISTKNNVLHVVNVANNINIEINAEFIEVD